MFVNGPTTLIYEQKVPSYNFSKNTIYLDAPVVLNDTEFCAGVYSNATDDGFRLEAETVTLDGLATGLKSYVLAPTCNVISFSSLADVNYLNEFCVETFVHGPSL